MRKEVELKAHVDKESAEELLNFLTLSFGIPKPECKNDTYYKDKNGNDVRIREENGKFYFTKKQQAMNGNIEVNNEDERIINAEEKTLLEKELTPFMKKIKAGYIWHIDKNSSSFRHETNIELVNVRGFFLNTGETAPKEKDLGHFLETEALFQVEKPDSTISREKVEIAKEDLEAFYKKCGIYENIEGRKYMSLLK